MGRLKVAFEFAKPQKAGRLLASNCPSGICVLSLPFVSVDKMLHLGSSCHYNSVFLSPLVPWLLKGEPCVMGERKIYKKRKPGAQCSLGRDYSQSVVSEPCVCSQGDFEWWVCESGDFCRDRSHSIGSGRATAQTENLAEKLGLMQLCGCDHIHMAWMWTAYLLCGESVPFICGRDEFESRKLITDWHFFVHRSRRVTARTLLWSKAWPLQEEEGIFLSSLPRSLNTEEAS